MKKRHLAYIDYGMGGVFFWILAESKEEIGTQHPSLRLLDEPPAWMDEAEIKTLQEKSLVYDLHADRETISKLLR